MALPPIFCPQCGKLVLEAKGCAACSWQRPVVAGQAGQPVWAVALETKLPRKGGHPRLVGNLVYFPTEAGQIVALNVAASDPESVIEWRFSLDNGYTCHSVAYWQDALLPGIEYTGGFPAPEGALILISRNEGQTLRRYPVEGTSVSTPAVAKDSAYFAVSSGWLYAVDLPSGKTLWRTKLESSWSWAPAAPLLTPTGLLVLASRSEQLVAFDLASQEVAWTFTAGGWLPHSPVWANGTIYVRCWDRRIYAIDAATGHKIWDYQADRDFDSEVWVQGDHLYIGAKDYIQTKTKRSRSYALYTLERKTGRRINRFQVEGDIIGRPVATDEAVFFATDDRSRHIESQGTLYALDPSGEAPLWEPLVVEQRFQSDLVVAGNLIVAGTRQGAIYGVCWREEAKVEAPEIYLAQEAWEEAAIAHALNGDFGQAAELYTNKLNRPVAASRLYLQAGQPERVLELLDNPQQDEARALAIEAANSLPDIKERAEALHALGEHMAAAEAFIEIEAWLEAGACFEAAQAWKEARAVYFRANAREKWEKLTRELELWDELVQQLEAWGNYAEAAKVQDGRGLFVKAANYYERAGHLNEALEAYRKADFELIPEEAKYRMAQLAQARGEVEVAITVYQALGRPEKAAALAESANHYQQAMELYRESSNRLKQAEMLEKLKRYSMAAEIFRQEKQEGRAAENWERQVDAEIEQLGGVRYARRNEQIEGWLNKAIELFEEEEEFAETGEAAEYFRACAERCRKKLIQIQRHPLIRITFQTEQLTVGQGSVVNCRIENIGWGTARQPALHIGSRDVEQEIDPLPLETLRRGQQMERKFVVIPKMAGAITLHVQLKGRSAAGDPVEFRVEGSPYKILEAQPGVPTEATTADDQLAVESEWGQLWDEGEAGSYDVGGQTAPVSGTELRRQHRISSLQRQRAQYIDNLNTAEEQLASVGGFAQASPALINRIREYEKRLAEIEAELENLQQPPDEAMDSNET